MDCDGIVFGRAIGVVSPCQREKAPLQVLGATCASFILIHSLSYNHPRLMWEENEVAGALETL